jgi:hypothetical protein
MMTSLSVCVFRKQLYVFLQIKLLSKEARIELLGCLHLRNKKRPISVIADQSLGLQTSPRHGVALHGQDPKKIV